VFDIHVPTLYPSDAQLDANGDVVVADYSSPGAVVAVSPSGHLVWRYGPTSGPGRLDHPSLAVPLPNGLVILNDDFRHRVLLLDPLTGRIVWQYGHTGLPGRGPGYLSIPDGLDPVAPTTVQQF
jgi:outer membrane protein assembly factor BamB